jgi:HD-GYP domain-containing protein (c-di-GMP phosphodiesterase class II)/pSer/pThr/pTyr-binding forkhead associated (FHA) protein
MPKTIILQDKASGKDHTITLPCVIGRGAEAGLSLPDQTVSHRHALVEEIDGRIWISDLGSTNGVFVNGVRIREKTPLQAGDVIRLGQIELVMSPQEVGISDRTVILPPLDPAKEPSPDLQRLRFIYELTSEMAVNQDLDALGEKIAGRLGGLFSQDRVYIALFQEDGSLKPVLTKSSSPGLPVSRSIINRMFQTGESFLLEDALREESFREQESIIALRIRSALCVPLVHHHRIYGLIYLDKGVPGAYRREDLEFLRSIGFILAPLIENVHLYHELKHAFHETVQALAETLDKRDPYTGGHTRRVMNYSLAIGRLMGLNEGMLENLKLASILHDIGKIGVRDHILLKSGRLDHDETETMNRHPQYGAEILEHVEQLKEVIPGVRSHHEKCDGTGYPDRLKGQDIPLIARIIAVADTFDAMTTDRPYQKAMSAQEALDTMRKSEGPQLDREIVEKFIHYCAKTKEHRAA